MAVKPCMEWIPIKKNYQNNEEIVTQFEKCPFWPCNHSKQIFPDHLIGNKESEKWNYIFNQISLIQ